MFYFLKNRQLFGLSRQLDCTHVDHNQLDVPLQFKTCVPILYYFTVIGGCDFKCYPFILLVVVYMGTVL